MRLGILSDTHDLLRPEVLEALAGVDAILHAGDISSPGILETLGELAPVYVVRGNNDKEWARDIPPFLDLELGGIRIYMTHKKKDLPKDLTAFDLVVVGHSHQYAQTVQGHTLLLNPGSCGPRRFHQPITLAVAQVRNREIRVDRLDIPHNTPKPLPGGDRYTQVQKILRETDRGRGPEEIAARLKLDRDLVEQVVRLYLTHPGVTVEGVMTKMEGIV